MGTAHLFKSRWCYTNGPRDLRLDLLRGFAALAMIVDHVGGYAGLGPLTGGNRFFVSAAEAFVFISGITMGMVYGGVILKSGIGAAVGKAIRRSATLYGLTIGLTLGFALAGHVLRQPWDPAPAGSGALGFVLQVVAMRRTVFLGDILLMYTLLVAAAVPALPLVARGRGLIVLVGSILLWMAWQLAPGSFALPWPIQGNTLFNLPAWQLLFFSGLVIGYHRREIEAWLARFSRRRLLWAIAAAWAIVAGLYLAQLVALDSLRANRAIVTFFFDKPNVPVGRLVVLGLLSISAYSALTFAWAPIRSLIGWLLLPLGQNALQAYSLHLGAVVLVNVAAVLLAGKGSIGVTTALQIGAVALVWSVIKLEAVLRRVASRSLLVPRQLAGTVRRRAAYDLVAG